MGWYMKIKYKLKAIIKYKDAYGYTIRVAMDEYCHDSVEDARQRYIYQQCNELLYYKFSNN